MKAVVTMGMFWVGLLLCWGKAYAAGVERINCRVKVVDSNGYAVVGAEVAIIEGMYDYAAGRIESRLAGPIENTNGDGVAVFNVSFELRNNAYIVVRKQGLALNAVRIPHHIAEPTAYVVLAEPTVLAGTVVDKAGRPVPSARVQVILNGLESYCPIGPEDWFTTKTDSAGRFSFDFVDCHATADFWIRAEGKAYYATFMDAGGNMGCRFAAGDKDIRIEAPEECKVTGKVIWYPERKSGAGVKVLARQVESWGNYHGCGRGLSDEKGNFTIDGLAPGTYDVHAYTPGEEDVEWIPVSSVKVKLNAGQVKTRVLVKAEKADSTMLDVTVVDSKTNEPIGNAYVSINNKSSASRHPCYYRLSRTAANGIVRLKVPAGKCVLSVGGGRRNEYGAIRQQPIELQKGKMNTFLARLEPSARYTGTVTDCTNNPISGADIFYYAADHEPVRTGSDGRFEASVGWLPNGRRFLIARDAQRNLSAIVDVPEEGGHSNVVLKPAMIVRGKVTDSEGKGIGAASVRLTVDIKSAALEWGLAETITEPTGNYYIPAILPKEDGFSYRVIVDAPGFGPVARRRVEFSGLESGVPTIEPFILQHADQSVTGKFMNVEGNPMAYKPIFWGEASGSGVKEGQPRRRVLTDAEGRFLIKDVCAGFGRIQGGYHSDPDGSGFLICKGGDREVTVVANRQLHHVTGGSLVGKKLAQIPEFGDLVDAEEARNKKILLFFWSHTADEDEFKKFKGMSGYLGEHGIYPIFVYMEEHVILGWTNNWIKEQNMDIASVIINEGTFELRRNYGIASLPHLVMADANGVITAEGFRLDDLAAKIEGAVN